MTIEANQNTVENAIKFLAGKCDFASSNDSVGFSKTDVDFGHSLSRSIDRYGKLSAGQHEAVVKTKNNGATRNGMIHKYRKQLEAAGFDVELLLDSRPAQPVESAQITSKRPSIVIDASYRRETDKALLIAHDGHEVWLPKSAISYRQGRSGLLVITIPGWLAASKNIAA